MTLIFIFSSVFIVPVKSVHPTTMGINVTLTQQANSGIFFNKSMNSRRIEIYIQITTQLTKTTNTLAKVDLK